MRDFATSMFLGLFPPPPTPDEIRKERERHERWLDEKVFPTAVDWDLNIKIPPSKTLCIRGESWDPYTLFDVEPGPVDSSNRGLVNNPDGTPFAIGYRHVILPKGQGLRLHKKNAWVYFTTDVVIPALWFNRVDNVWMSITPMEMLSQRPAIRHARGTVLIGGLGMGWMMNEICKKKSVKKVLVVEKSKHLVDWFGQRICDAQPKVRLTVGDVFDHIGLHEEDVALLDIWRSLGDSRVDRRVDAARRRNPDLKIWRWGA